LSSWTPLALVEGSPALKFFKSVICLSTSTICLSNFSSWLRTDATYCGLTVLGGAAFGLFTGLSLPFPTTETFPVDLDKSSLVKTFLGFLASVEDVESGDFEAGGGALESVVCAAAGKAKSNARMDKESGRSIRILQSCKLKEETILLKV